MFLTVKFNRVVVPDERHIFHEWNAVDNVVKRWTFGGRQIWLCILALLLVCDLGHVTLLLNVGSYLQIEPTTQGCCEDFEQDTCRIPSWLILIIFSIHWVN